MVSLEKTQVQPAARNPQIPIMIINVAILLKRNFLLGAPGEEDKAERKEQLPFGSLIRHYSH